jgi:hypothetical protein
MDSQPSLTGAFTLSKSSLPPQALPEHHHDLWTTIEAGLRTGRTFIFAECCKTIHDKRKKYDEDEEPHTETKTLFEKLGKRRFNNLEEFSAAISDIENALDPNLSKISFNRNHSCTQHSLELAQVKRRLKELEERSQEQIDFLGKRLSILEDSNQKLHYALQRETKHRLVLLDFLREERGIKAAQELFPDFKPKPRSSSP